MFLLYLVTLPILLYIFFEIRYFKYKRIINRLPGPPILPFLGNAHIIGVTPAEVLNKLFLWWNKNGKKNFRLWAGYAGHVVISDVKDMECILSSNTLIQKTEIYEMLHPWLGEGLITSFGLKWFKHRKMITPAFHFKILQKYMVAMNVNSTKFIEKLYQVSEGETIFDFQEMVRYFTLDVLCDTTMGVHINAMDNNDDETVTAFKYMCSNINTRAIHPLNRKNFWYRFSPEYPQYARALKTLQDFTYGVIEKRQEALRNSNSDAQLNTTEPDEYETRHKQAFLDTLLSAQIDERPLTSQEIYEEVSTVMFAGHDSVSSAISFAIYLLSRHPRIQQKVYAEQQQIFVDKQFQRPSAFNEISQMKYLDLVFKETLRLYPSVPIVGRRTDCDYDINGTLIPKDTTVFLFIMAMGYIEKTFEDPYRFRPERFDNEKHSIKSNPFAYVPFSAGPRNCIGQKFAVLEFKTIISIIVRTFEILPPLDELVSTDGYVEHFVGLLPEEQHKVRPNPHKYNPILSAVITLKSENGILIRLRPRK